LADNNDNDIEDDPSLPEDDDDEKVVPRRVEAVGRTSDRADDHVKRIKVGGTGLWFSGRVKIHVRA
jgi:hypothetical protein